VIIREASDLHLEFQRHIFESDIDKATEHCLNVLLPMDTDKESVLVLAGDIGSLYKSKSIPFFIKHVCSRFKHVIYVLGNHEHYFMDINTSLDKIRDAIEEDAGELSNLYIVGNEPAHIQIDDVNFLVGTLWTDCGNSDIDIQEAIFYGMNDFRHIRDDIARLSIERIQQIHANTVETFEQWLSDFDNCVVVTHHMPTFKAVHPKYMQGPPSSRRLNHAFASNLEYLLTYKPKLWFFGHTHTPYDEVIEETRLICNPYGYPNEFSSYKQDLVIEL
jgi:predicted phosphodiesterase